MHCAGCVAAVEKALSRVPGVEKAVVNLTLEKANVQGEASSDLLVEAVNKTGYTASPVIKKDDIGDDLEKRTEQNVRIAARRMWVSWGATTLIMCWMIPEMVYGIMWPNPQLFNLGMVLLSAIVLIGPGKETIKSAWVSTKHQVPNMDVLIAIGSIAALSTGLLRFAGVEIHSFAGIAGMILAFHLTGRYIETRARGKSSEAIRKLMTYGAPFARILKENQSEVEVPVQNLRPGNIMIVKAGEKIPTDGNIIEGKCSLDESIATGESNPVKKTEGDTVIGGTINLDGYLKVKATKVGLDTFLAQMAKLVEQAQTTKVPVQIFADKMTARFVPVILLISGLTFGSWMAFPELMKNTAGSLGAYFPWVDLSLGTVELALFAAIAVLVIACPCALGLATPTALMVGSGKGAENGILVRKGSAIQRLNDITTIIFDKTGTITTGKHRVNKVVSLGAIGETDLIRMAASLERRSNHPLAKAIVSLAEEKNIKLDDISDAETIPGEGIRGHYGSSVLTVGNRKFVNFNGDYTGNGSTVFLAIDGTPYGAFELSDEVKASSGETIKILKAAGLKIIMLTGDKPKEAERITKAVNIDIFHAEVLPEEKASIIEEYQSKGEVVAMVGDGINDAPSLAVADVGIAMGTGTDIAIESGDIVIVNGNLKKIPAALKLAKRTFLKIKQNLFWASIYNLIAIPLAIAGVLHPVLAEAAMALSSLNVVGNSNRLRRLKLS